VLSNISQSPSAVAPAYWQLTDLRTKEHAC
jgi:hypothetical protein